MIAQLAVAAAVYAIDKPYSYRVPEGMQVQPGLRVLVPFGRGNRRSEAVVLALQDTAQRAHPLAGTAAAGRVHEGALFLHVL